MRRSGELCTFVTVILQHLVGFLVIVFWFLVKLLPKLF